MVILHPLVATAIIVIAAFSVFAQSKLDLKGTAINDDLLVEILNDSDMQEVAPDPPNIQNYFLRLYSIGELGTCAPEAETEVTCSFRYYLAVSDGGLGVRRAVYFLGEVGEIRSMEWIAMETYGPAKLRVEVGSYPKHVLPYNSKLTVKMRFYEIEVALDKIKIRAVE
jgi:hypothetical protein